MNKIQPILFEDALQMPEYAHLYEVLRYVQTASDSELMPHKYQKSLEYLAFKKMSTIVQMAPNTPLKTVVSLVTEQLPEGISAEALLKTIRFVVKNWQRRTPIQKALTKSITP